MSLGSWVCFGHSKLDEMIDRARNKHFDQKFREHEHVEVVGDEKV